MGVLLANHRIMTKEARKLLKASNIAMHIGSVAAAIEAMEQLLVEKGVLKDGELMERLEKVLHGYYARDQFIPPDGD